MNSNQEIYRQKYLKYKKKYTSLKKQIDLLEGGDFGRFSEGDTYSRFKKKKDETLIEKTVAAVTEGAKTAAKVATEVATEGAKTVTEGAKNVAKVATEVAKEGAKVVKEGAKVATVAVTKALSDTEEKK